MAWLTLIIGGAVLLAGLLGQCFGIRRGNPLHPGDKRAGKIIISVGSAVVGLWLMTFSLAHLLHAHAIGH